MIEKNYLKEVSNNLLGFFLAGYDTTLTALNYSLLMLIKYPDEMKKLQDEIDNTCLGPIFTYENIENLEYLDMFLKGKFISIYLS